MSKVEIGPEICVNRAMTAKKRSWKFLILSLLLLMVCGCGSSDDDKTSSVKTELVYHFLAGPDGWTGDFADYPDGREAAWALSFRYATLPPPLDTNKGALMLSGNNHSDDLFMFVKKKISGLLPDTLYQISFLIEFASNIPDGMTGIGGSPGEGVIIKAGATAVEPVKVLDPSDGRYRMNIDKGNQTQGGRDMMVLGNFANGTDKNEYTLKTVVNPVIFPCRTNANGELWLVAGTDSGFEGITTIYYNRIEAILSSD